MNKRNLLIGAGIAALGIALIALPSPSASRPSQQDDAKLEKKLQQLQSEIGADRALQSYARAFVVSQELADLQQPEVQDFTVMLGDEGASWLGVETQEVSSDFAKEHKLAAERGVVLHKIISDSPAAKSGLKENDVVTEINGQRVEGTAQFRRMIREIPAGRAVQLSVWRDGKQQSITATLGKAEERHSAMMKVSPQAFTFRVPEMPEIPDVPNFEWNGSRFFGGKARLGIDAEDLSGQLGGYFGAPDGEGILVRNVNNDSPGAKAGLKA